MAVQHTPVKSAATCNNVIELDPEFKTEFPNCEVDHVIGIGTYDCGTKLSFKVCKKTHTITCSDCGGNFTPTATKPIKAAKICHNIIELGKQTEVNFSECETHTIHSLGAGTWTCGQKVTFNHGTHILKCRDCDGDLIPTGSRPPPTQPCTNTIVVSEVTEDTFLPECNVKHSFGPSIYKCGHQMDFLSCPKKHFIWCLDHGGKPLPQPSSSTPARPNTMKTIKDLRQQVLNLSKIVDDKNENIIEEENCTDAQHLFELRTKKFLSAPARKFSQAHRACKYHLERSKVPISKDFGDKLLQELLDCYDNVEKMRQYCLEPFTEAEMHEGNYDHYLEHKWDLVSECRQLHDQYFNAGQIELELSQNKNASLPVNFPAWSKPVVPQPLPRPQVDENSEPSPFERNFTHVRQDSKQHNFKLKEELALVTKFNASQPRDYMAFRANWNNFIEKMNKAKRSPLDMYYALLSVLEGKAKEFVQTKYPRDESYVEAINKLDQLFWQPANLLRDMMHTLNKSPKMVDSYDSLLQGMTKLWDAWADLNHAKLSNDQLKGLFFISASEKNLSKESWKFWLEIQNLPRNAADPMAYYDINAYMGAISKAMTNAEKMQNAIGKPQWAEQDRFNKPKSTLYGSYNLTSANQDKNESCIFCKQQKHKYQLFCHKLKRMSPDEISDTMRKNDIRCSMCLEPNHITINCKATKDGILKPCPKKVVNNKQCGKFHTIFLHRYSKPVSVSNLTINSTTDDAKASVETVEPQN